MKPEEQETSKLVVLRASERMLLDRGEACGVLGIEPRMMRMLGLLGCGAPSLKVRNVRLYRREDLLALRARWMDAVGVEERDRHSRRRGRHNGAATDPLMTLLAQRAVIHRLVIMLLWGMILFGGAIGLILY
ncbi:hypothetical protein [Novacetimonas pomaceti]|uniref:hypothetical protein n=1 Tax=Novacetimonas pomaceti TaxID=2021998 RepID=UPI000D7C5A96|nr:hypothetical protein [Novacetimonas pomaceti]